LRLALFVVCGLPSRAARFIEMADDEPAGPPVESRTAQLLSRHATISRLAGLQQFPCRHLTSLCPDRCGHGGTVAVFDVVRVLEYFKEPTQQYGDPEQQRFHVKLGVTNPLMSEFQELPGLDDAIRALAVGQLVRLDWRHDYVTTTWVGGGSAKGPARPVTRLEPYVEGS